MPTIAAFGSVGEVIELTVTDDRDATGTDTMTILSATVEAIELTPGPPGPQGPPGISPEEIAAIQQTLDENRALLADLPQLKKQLEELAAQAP